MQTFTVIAIGISALPVYIAGAKEGEEGGDDLDDVPDGVETSLDVTEGVIPQQVSSQQSSALTGIWEPLSVTLNGVTNVITWDWVMIIIMEEMMMMNMASEEVTQLYHRGHTHSDF